VKIQGHRTSVVRGLKLVLLTGAFAIVIMAISTGMSAGNAHADSMNWDAVAQCE